MILQSLRLENIRSYTHELIEFPKGSVMLSGDIGSGKSTILLAIEFALFGIMRAELSGDSLLRHGKKQGHVELKFEIDDNEYIVKRSLKKSKDSVVQDSGYIISNGRKFEGTPVELKAKIIGILGYPEELITKFKSFVYRYTVYTPQEEMKQILFEEKDVRLDTLRKLFGIDKYKTIRGNAVLFVREIKRKQQELKIKLENYDELFSEKEDKSKKQEVILEELSASKKELESVKAEEKSIRANLEAFEKEIRRLNEIKKEFEVISANITGKKNHLDTIIKRREEEEKNMTLLGKKLEQYTMVSELLSEKETEKESEALAGLIEKINSLSDMINAAEKEIMAMAESTKGSIRLEAEINALEEKISAKKEQEALLDELREKEKKSLVGIEKCNLGIMQAETIIKNIKELKNCPTCGQDVDDKHRHDATEKEKSNIREMKEEMSRIGNMKSKILENIEKIRRNLDKISQTEEEIRKKREQLIKVQENTKHIVRKQKELSELYARKKILEEKAGSDNPDGLMRQKEDLAKRLSDIRENNIKFREKKNLIENIALEKKSIDAMKIESAKIQSEADELKKRREDIEKSIRGSEKTEREYMDLKIRYEELKEKQKNKEVKFATLTQEKDIISSRVAEIEKKLHSLDKVRAEIKYLSEIELWFDEFFMNLMATMEKHIMVSIHKEFESLFREWLSVLIEDIEASLDDEFSVRIIQDGYETPVESLSGGEKTSVALAYRLALNKVINDLIPSIKTKDLIILDEPTDGFSSEQLDKVRDVLHELDMMQTIIVSHEPKMESMVQNIIRITKSDNTSKASGN